MHRAVKGLLRNDKTSHVQGIDLEGLAVNCSERERGAAEAERKAVDMARASILGRSVGQVFDGVKNLYIVRRFGPGALEAATAVQGVHLMLQGELILMLATVIAGTSASILLRVLKPIATFSDAYAREIAATSQAPPLPEESAAPALPDSGRKKRKKKGEQPAESDGSA